MALEYGFFFGEDTTSGQFSDVIHALVGDGITDDGQQLAVTINGFEVTVGTGRAMAAGRWIWNDSPKVLGVHAAGNRNDRMDVVAVRVNYPNRTANLELISGVDYNAIRADPSTVRTDEEYWIILYMILVRRGATALGPETITDLRADANLCGMITPLSRISASALRAYDYLTVGFDQEVARIQSLGDQLIAQGTDRLSTLQSIVKSKHAAPDPGELMFSYVYPSPTDQWRFYANADRPNTYKIYQYSSLGLCIAGYSKTSYSQI